MTTNRTIELIEAADTVPSENDLPAGLWTADGLLARVDERSHPMTELTTAPPGESEPTSNPWRGPFVALGIAATILLFVGVVALITVQVDGAAPAAPDIDAASDPLTVVTEFDRLLDAADPAFILMYDADVFGDEPWLEVQLSEARYQWVTGMTTTADCSVDGNQVTCIYTDTSGFDRSMVYETGTVVYTVENGVIRWIDADRYESPVTADRAALAGYRTWVGENEPEKFDDLFVFGQTLAIQTDELVRVQRIMISRYQEATGRGG